MIFPASPTLCSSRAVGELPVDLGLRGFAAVFWIQLLYTLLPIYFDASLVAKIGRMVCFSYLRKAIFSE